MAMTEKDLNEILGKLPGKVQKNRSKHILVKDCSQPDQEIEANTRTIPGIITNRGCAYAGCKGVVLGPLKDMIHIVHGRSDAVTMHGVPGATRGKRKIPARII